MIKSRAERDAARAAFRCGRIESRVPAPKQFASARAKPAKTVIVQGVAYESIWHGKDPLPGYSKDVYATRGLGSSPSARVGRFA